MIILMILKAYSLIFISTYMFLNFFLIFKERNKSIKKMYFLRCLSLVPIWIFLTLK